MMQGRAKREKSSMAEEVVFVGVDVAKKTLDISDSISKNTRKFENDPDGIASTIHYIARLKPSKITLKGLVITRRLWLRLYRQTVCR